MAPESKGYRAENIQVLKGLEPVRKRPGMYIGSTGTDGLHHLIVEVFDNSRDEAMGGFADDIEIVFLPDSTIRVTDNGRGIPVDIHKATKVSALETIMTTLHAGGKFDGDAYKIAGGLHGVGVSVVNALSTYLRAEVYKEGGIYTQEYSQGKRKALVKKIGTTKLHGTVVTFRPDESIFSTLEFNWDRVVAHMRQQAYLVKNMRIRLIDARSYKEKLEAGEFFYFKELLASTAGGGLDLPSTSFYFEGGLLSLVAFHTKKEKPIHKNIFYVDKKIDNMFIEIALQYIDDITAKETSFANNTSTPDGGMHMTGFRTALTRILNDYGRKNGFVKENDDNFTGDDVREGLVAVISVKLPDPQFEGQTKSKLGSVEARGATETVFGEAFAAFLEEHPDDARSIIGKVALAVKARKAAKAAKDSVLRKGALDGLTLPGKLADCQTRKAEEAELFIVEGDSAGGSSKQGRDRHTQAVLPLRGKILNVEKARLDKMLAFKEIKALVIAIGAAIGDTFDLEKVRYHKIIIATDADVDGAHIRTLLLTLFYRYFPAIISAGYLYIAQPPLYKISRGKTVHYVYSDEEKNKTLEAMGGINQAEISAAPDEGAEEEEAVGEGEAEVEATGPAKKQQRINIQRYKGLGEMNPEELWETTMDPARRILKKVNVDSAEEANDTFNVLMGNDVAPRKLFIQTHAKMANLDV